MPVVIEPVRPEHLPEIAALADVIWHSHYPGIISPAQIDYMLARMYPVDVMRLELEDNIEWLRVLLNSSLRGFTSFGPTGAAKEFKLHKLYIHPDSHRQGLGTALLQEVETRAGNCGAAALTLNVNKRNAKAIAAYHRRGFTIRESIVADIGGGFVVDDFIMAKPLPPTP